MDKRKLLDKLRLEIESCDVCKKAGWGEMVFGEGDPDASVLFVGEAPGRQEAKSGRPFIGRSGQLLRRMIREIGLQEERVYITSPVKFLPNKMTPTQKEIIHSRGHFNKQVEIINPKVIVLLGKTAATAVLGRALPILKEHGTIIKENEKKIVVTIHPAAALRFPKLRSAFASDFQIIKSIL